METFKIVTLGPADADRALAFYAAAGTPYNPADTAALRENLASGGWTVLAAAEDGADIGMGYLNWHPKYSLYRRLSVPEFQDLRVLPGHRRRGAGTALITAAEDAARSSGARGLGMSVGLDASFGAAQRLYAGLGFVPDGQGVTYDREPVAAGSLMPVDDNLALMLLKMF